MTCSLIDAQAASANIAESHPSPGGASGQQVAAAAAGHCGPPLPVFSVSSRYALTGSAHPHCKRAPGDGHSSPVASHRGGIPLGRGILSVCGHSVSGKPPTNVCCYASLPRPVNCYFADRPQGEPVRSPSTEKPAAVPSAGARLGLLFVVSYVPPCVECTPTSVMICMPLSWPDLPDRRAACRNTC